MKTGLCRQGRCSRRRPGLDGGGSGPRRAPSSPSPQASARAEHLPPPLRPSAAPSRAAVVLSDGADREPVRAFGWACPTCRDRPMEPPTCAKTTELASSSVVFAHVGAVGQRSGAGDGIRLGRAWADDQGGGFAAAGRGGAGVPPDSRPPRSDEALTRGRLRRRLVRASSGEVSAKARPRRTLVDLRAAGSATAKVPRFLSACRIPLRELTGTDPGVRRERPLGCLPSRREGFTAGELDRPDNPPRPRRRPPVRVLAQ